MKKVSLLALALLFTSPVSYGQQPAPAHSLGCSIIETIRDAETDDVKQQSYVLIDSLPNPKGSGKIAATSRFALGFKIEVTGCLSCASEGSTPVPQIQATITEETSGAKSVAFHRALGIGMLTLGERTIAYICSVR